MDSSTAVTGALPIRDAFASKARTSPRRIADHPFFKFGNGPRNLVIFPSLIDALFPMDLPLAYGQVVYYFGHLRREFTIYGISRKRRLPVGYSTREMAADYAQVLKQIGPSYVIGMSIGGMIAQHLAFDHPELVPKLVLIASAYRMGNEGLQIARRWIPWAKMRMWNQIYEETVDLSFNRFRRFFYNAAKPLIASRMEKAVQDPNDFIISGHAGILHDSWSILPSIQAPVLMISGTQDRFFSEDLFYQMEEKLPAAKLAIFKGGRHGVYEENRTYCSNLLKQWLLN